MYYVRKIVGGWVDAIAYNCLYTGWLGLNKFLRKIFVHEKNKKSAKFSTNAMHQNCLTKELIIDHHYFSYIFNSNTMPELG